MNGKEVAELRKRLDISQEDFAQRIGISRSHLGKMEVSNDPITDRMMYKIEKFIADIGQAGISLSKAEEPAATYRKAKAGHSVASSHRVKIRGMLASVIDDLPEAIYDIFEVEGSSMESTLTQGDRLLCRVDSVENIIDNRVYVLVLEDQEMSEYRSSGVWIKRCSHRKSLRQMKP